MKAYTTQMSKRPFPLELMVCCVGYSQHSKFIIGLIQRFMNLKQQILKALKPKVSAYGFNKKELQSAAAIIADNLSYEDDASEEDIQSSINDKVDEYMPLLKFGQSQANRIINEKRISEEEEKEKEEEKKPAPESGEKKDEKPKDEQKPDEKPKDEQPAWAKAFMEKLSALDETVGTLKSDLGTFKAEKTAQGRTKKMQELLKDAGAFGTSALSTFSRLSFKDDDDFNAYYEETKNNLDAFKKEQVEKGLDITPPGGSEKKQEVREITDKQLEDIAAMF